MVMFLEQLFSAGRGKNGTFRHFDQKVPGRYFIVAAVVVTIVAVFAAWVNIGRSQAFLQSVLAEKGKVLLLTLESGIRSGSRTLAGMRFQYFLEELVNREDVRFIAVAMSDGTIVAHTNPQRVGGILSSEQGEFSASDLEALISGHPGGWLQTSMEGGPAFIVFDRFLAHEDGEAGADSVVETPYIFLGLSTLPLEAARHADERRALLYGGGVLLFGWLLVLCSYALARVQASGRGQRDAEALVDQLALNLPDGLLLLDTRGRVVSMNQSAQHLLLPEGPGTDPQGIEATMARLPESLLALIDELLREATMQDTELVLEREGRPVFLNVRGGHVGEADNRLGSIMLLRDVSNVRLLEAEVRRREKLAAVGNLAAGVAHELRNPLSSIKGYATYFSERFPEGSEEREAAHIMVRETDRLNRTITDLLGLARPTQVRVKPVELARLLADAARLIRPDAEAKGVSLTVVSASHIPLVLADPDRLRQVFLNLCINALDAMPNGGHLEMRLFADVRPGGQVIVEVADTGKGISQEDLAHIFDPYFTTKGHGTGLGLPTVYKIMEAHGGTVAVSTKPGKGTVFRLCFKIPVVSARLEDKKA